MEQQPSRLASLTLVSKYYPVANYSYPRNESSCSNNGAKTSVDRSSSGSFGSLPGLIDDRSDTETSVEEEDNYHTQSSDLWDSFWDQRAEKTKLNQQPEVQPRKQYPALILSIPQRSSRPYPFEGDSGNRSPGWPLPDAAPAQKTRPRQPAANYSPFPKPIALPPRAGCPIPSWQSSRSRECPRRPSRPDESLLAPCIPQQSPVKAVFPSSLKPQASAKEQKSTGLAASSPVERPSTSAGYNQTKTCSQHRPLTPPEMQRPRTAHASRPSIRAISPVEVSRPSSGRGMTSFDAQRSEMSFGHRSSRPSTPSSTDGHSLFNTNIWSTAHESPSKNAHRYTKSHPPSHHRSRSRLIEESTVLTSSEPQSVFEDDSDSEDTKRSFFRFHKRSGSDIRRSARNSARNSDSEVLSSRRARASTAPSSPVRQPQPDRKRSAVDVLSCMLGRRRSKGEND
ncbi:unnamed protein product [Clonostachys chloroleuca]|uniref:Uncharacterized protein n=1 Tax=Clonostachys chloroleuca TaxID=1926264 RepID=A0AA35Q9N3_9HYPO|nr:unnamed protein product [Clonostachys chloroleuca]